MVFAVATTGVMAVAFVISLASVPAGKVEDVVEEPGAEPLAKLGA
jgi:hypothetical protein